MSSRVLCVTSSFPRWRGDSATPFVLHLAEDLQALGFCVDVLAPHALGAGVEELMDGVRVERFRYLWPRTQQTVCYQGGALINLRRNRVNLLKVPALVAAEWAAVGRRVASGRYGLVHSHWILPQGFVGALVAPRYQVPHIVTVHGGDVFALQGRLLKHFKRFALRRADAITVNSSVTESAVMDLGPADTPVVRIPMGVSLSAPARESEEVQAVRRRFRCGAGPLVVFVGRLVEEKGVADFMQAIALLGRALPDATGLIVGEGQERGVFERLVSELGVQGSISFTGWVASDRVPNFLSAADVFVLPSRQYEAQGLSVLEAMAAGTPVIATRLGGIVDSVIHEQTGLLVDERAPDQIAAAVERLATDSELGLRLSANARLMVEARFSRQASAEAFSRLYSDLLAGRPIQA